MVSFDRVFEVLDAPESITDRPGAVDLVDPVGRIELDHVRFRYPAAAEVTVRSLEAPSALGGTDPDRDVLVDVSLVLEPGETVALVGSSGSGKTSLASLLPRLYDVSDGAVRIADLNVDGINDLVLGVVGGDGLGNLHAACGELAQHRRRPGRDRLPPWCRAGDRLPRRGVRRSVGDRSRSRGEDRGGR
jgi:energy-coupling factor transporter ATP-binding protein EcfA2